MARTMTPAEERAAARAERRARVSERMIFGVPQRIMVPRIVLIVVTFGLVAFGMLMIFSASSITAMTDASTNYDAAYYLKRQAGAAMVGLLAVAVIVISGYHFFARTILPLLWVATSALLVAVVASSLGRGAYGATRWIEVGPLNVQPSEFAKVTIILTAANIATQYFEEHTIDFDTFVKYLLVGVAIPVGLILIQPDKGTTIICACTLLVMGFLAGFSLKLLVPVLMVFGAFAVFLSLKDDYSRQRMLTMLDPWRDPYGDGYQLIQGFYAFGSGGLFGVGIGMSRQKYSYLPMAHNDFIFAVVGEELGLAGTLGVLCAFLALAWAGLRIARYAPDLTGRLIAAGCTSMIIIQLFVNVLGVLGVIPLTGKPVPFISYGGSSIMSCLMLVGFVGAVSRECALPETVYESRRRTWGVAGSDAYDDAAGFSLVGDPTPRSARTDSALSERAVPTRLTVLGGGRSRGSAARGADGSEGRLRATSPEALRAARDEAASMRGRVSVDESGRRRVDLGPDAATRLRSSRQNGRR